MKWTFFVWLLPAIAFGAESSSTAIDVGSKYSAADTLTTGNETNNDARDCLTNLCWKPAKFDVRLESAERGCGDYLVRFPSPRPIGNSTYDLVAMEWFAAHDDHHAIRSAPAIVVVHESGRGMTVGRLVARGLNGLGLHTFMVQLPGYGARRPKEPLPVERMLNSMPQAVADVRRARDAVFALPVVDHSMIGVQGTSLGGFVTATVAGLDRGYDRVFILLAGGNLQDIVLHGARDAAKLHDKLFAAGVTEDQIKELARQVEPLRLAHRINPESTWLYSGKYDNVVPPRCSLALAKSAHLAEDHHIEIAADHYSGIVYLPQVLQQIYQRMTEPLESHPQKDRLHEAK